MRRRARETFVLGAERLSGEVELDLRNQAEADHEPIELDHAAAAEPAVCPHQQPPGSPAGARVRRDEPTSSSRGLGRPRPSVRAFVLAAAAICAAVWVVLRGGDDEGPDAKRLAVSPAPVGERSVAAARGRSSRHLTESTRRRPTSPDHSSARVPGTNPGVRRDARRPLAPTPPAVSEQPPVAPPAPVPAAPPAPVGGAPAAPSASPKPVQSAAAVRREFGP